MNTRPNTTTSNQSSLSSSSSNKKAKKESPSIMETSSSSGSTTSTKQKKEIQSLKSYILQCPNVPQSSIAIQSCLNTLNNELKKMERDEKLLLKFAKEKAVTAQSTSSVPTVDDTIDDDDDVVCVDMESIQKQKTIDDHDHNDIIPLNDEWQDIQESGTAPTHHGGSENMITSTSTTNTTVTTSPLGTKLAQTAISDMTSANITISTPTAALALAIHSSLRSNILGFKCTGVVPEGESCFRSDVDNNKNNNGNGIKKKTNNGFAPPVRELPKNKFLPDDWDKFASITKSTTTNKNLENHFVTLRYRKNGIGATILRVTSPTSSTVSNLQNNNSNNNNDTIMAEINFGPEGGEPWSIQIPMDRHINVDGLNAALENNKQGRIKPALHYKALSQLLSEFCQCADLGIVKESEVQVMDEGDYSRSRIDNAVDVNMTNNVYNTSSVPAGAGYDESTNNNRPRRPPTIENDLLGGSGDGNARTYIPGGDFAGDLLPSGIPTPGFANPIPGGRGGGNLMGMNHPYFQGSGFQDDDDNYDNDPLRVGGSNGGNFPRIGGLGMQPRFDPFYPPGVRGGGGGRFGPGGRGGRSGRGRGGRGRGNYSGDPNPDHQRPPNTFGSNMFM